MVGISHPHYHQLFVFSTAASSAHQKPPAGNPFVAKIQKILFVVVDFVLVKYLDRDNAIDRNPSIDSLQAYW